MGRTDEVVPGFFVRAVAHGLREEQVSRNEHDSHLPLMRDQDEPQCISWQVLNDALGNASVAHGEPDLGLLLGRRITESNLDVLGPLVVACRTMRDCIEHSRAVMVCLIGGSEWHLEQSADESRYVLKNRTRGASVDQLLVSMAYHLTQRFVGEYRSDRVTALFPQPEPTERSTYEACFGRQVRFGTGKLGVAMPTALLDLPRPGTDAALAIQLRQIATQRFAHLQPADTWTLKVEQALRGHPHLANVDADQLAARFHISGRMLRRRVGAEGKRLSDLINGVRFERARHYLEATDSPIAEIAELLGYSEMSCFQRAFKRWAGQGPAEYRTTVKQS